MNAYRGCRSTLRLGPQQQLGAPRLMRASEVAKIILVPHGQRIAFVRSPERDGMGSVWVAAVYGGPASMLHSGPVGWPSWSPDGSLLAVFTGPSDDAGAPFRIGVLDLASGALTELGSGADRPTWTGDGSAIVTSRKTSDES